MTDDELFAEIERRVREHVFPHEGSIAHGFSTPEPSTCNYCWIVDAIRTRHVVTVDPHITFSRRPQKDGGESRA